MKNDFELARECKGTTGEEVYNELFSMIKDDPAWLNEIVHDFVINVTDRIMEIKSIVDLYNNPEKLKENDENSEKN
jgi:hypothetical protein